MRQKSNPKKRMTVAAAVLAAVCLFLMLLPLPVRQKGESYACVWEDGSVSTESFASAYAALEGMDGEGVLLQREGKRGWIASDTWLYPILNEGSLAELLSCRVTEESGIVRAALLRTFSGLVWYDGDFFRWTGTQVERVKRATGKSFVLLGGAVSAKVLARSEAETLYLRAGAEFGAKSLIGTSVCKVIAEAPYSVLEGGVYRSAGEGKRFVAATKDVTELTVDGETLYADEGALLACYKLSALSLPFLGSGRDSSEEGFCGGLAYLFSDGKEYFVPDTLHSLKVTGGRIDDAAFYRCTLLRSLNLCGVRAEDISPAALEGLPLLEELHSPRPVPLAGFSSSVADCGCTVYRRTI